MAWRASVATLMWLLLCSVAAIQGSSAGSVPGGSAAAVVDGNVLNRQLRESLVIECQRTGIRVSFRRPVLEQLGIPAQALSFNDTACRASNNGTHYVLTTTFADCGGRVNRELNKTANRILLVDPADVEAAEFSRAEPSFRRRGRAAVARHRNDDDDGGDDDESSGSGDGPRAQAASIASATASVASLASASLHGPPDLGGRAPLWALPFVCDYSKRTQTSGTGAGRATAAVTSSIAAQLKLNMSVAFFTSDSFVAPLRQYPLRVAVGEEVFVQVSPESGFGEHTALRVVINSCYLTSGASEGGSKRVTLLDNGCSSQGSYLTWYGEYELASHRRFSFRVAQQFPTFTFLHCSVDLCSLRPTPGVDSSVAQPRACTTQAQHCILSSRGDADQVETFRVHSGALLIVSNDLRWRPPTGSQRPRLSASPSLPTADARKASSTTAVGELHTAAVPPQRQPQPPSGAMVDHSSKSDSTSTSATASATGPVSGGATGAAAAAAAASGGGGLPVGTVIGIAVGAFVVGCATVGALWLIHTCTDPRRRLLSVPTTEDSGSQTSRSPMSV